MQTKLNLQAVCCKAVSCKGAGQVAARAPCMDLRWGCRDESVDPATDGGERGTGACHGGAHNALKDG